MKKKRFNRIIGGLISGIIITSIWLFIFYIALKENQYYGLAILPAIVIAIFLFIIGFIIGYFIVKKIKNINNIYKL